MAKVNNENSENVNTDKLLEKMRKETRKKSDSVSFAKSQYTVVSDWIDTGDYGLNRIISGDIYKGIPSGRVVIMSGAEATGKSFVGAKVVSNAIKKHGYNYVVIFDSEGGLTPGMFDEGVDTEKIEHVLVDTIEDWTIKMNNQISLISEMKKKDPDFKAMILTDSIGMLPSYKIVNDVNENGRLPADQGARAKVMGDAISTIMMPVVRNDIPCFLINHVYDSPSGMQGKVMNQRGGKRVMHSGHVSIQCTKALEKNEDNKKDNSEQFYEATVLKFFTTKNRIVKPFYETKMYLNFSKGPMFPHFGLMEPAYDFGILIKPSKGWYQIPETSDRSYRRVDILKNIDNVWDPVIDKFNELSKQHMQYSSGESEEDINEELVEEAEKVEDDLQQDNNQKEQIRGE